MTFLRPGGTVPRSQSFVVVATGEVQSASQDCGSVGALQVGVFLRKPSNTKYNMGM
jgi:hypothetical protein